MSKVVYVVAAAIIAADQRLFIAKRPEHVHQGGLWEFPGGKQEVGETALAALQRELSEEIGIQINSAGVSPLIKIEHDYGDKQVILDVYMVRTFTGEAHGAEGQETRWIDIANIAEYQFPAANQGIIHALNEYFTINV
jgi:8-oxo-dGTP diphosphatase